MLFKPEQFASQQDFSTMPQFGLFALHEEQVLYSLTEENYTPCLNVVKSVNFKSPKSPIHNVLSGKNIVESLLALAPLTEGKYTNIFYRMPSMFDEQMKDSQFKNSEFLVEVSNVLNICKNLLTNSGTLHLQVTEDFVSIAKLAGQEIFGKSNYIATFIVNSNKAGTSKNGVSVQHHYILTFAKDKSNALNKYGYKVGNVLQFCTEDLTKKQVPTENATTTQDTDYPYADNISPFKLNNYMRSDTRNTNGDKSYFPIYYYPSQSQEKIDFAPRLFLENPGYPGIVELLPIGENSIHYRWNGIKNTVYRMIDVKSFCVVNLGGSYKLMYKSRPNYSESGYELKPINTILDDNYSNVSITNLMQKMTMVKDKYYGFNANLLKLLLNTFSREGEDILFIGDDYLTGMASYNETGIDRNYTTVLTDETKCNATINNIALENEMQIIHYGVIYKTQKDILSFVEEFDLYKPTALFKHNCALTYVDNDKYSVRQTPDGDVVLIFKTRYDIQTYEEASTFVKSILSSTKNNYCIIHYKSDDNVFLGSDHFEGLNTIVENIPLTILTVQSKLYRNLYFKFQ